MDALNLIRTRHSCRHFSSKPVEREKVEQVVEAGRFAPSGGDNQYTHFLVIRDHAVLEKIARVACAEFAKMEVTPTTYRSLANCIRFSKLGKCTFHYNAPVLIVTANREGYGNAMADCACAVENMLLMANALDLGGCYINQLNWLRDNPVMTEYLRGLGLAEGEKVFASLVIGYADTLDGLPFRRIVSRKGNPVTWVDGNGTAGQDKP
ncbi:MAG: nitroreductase family protein [Succiniclasticum sp.]|nr:nitroreductase family protein [Selenomonadales bacterium]MDY6303579.1 nitroreductase family protein [Succiniclasticum sp.]MDY6345375.1 nitroreductase family protein [Succiniclasticum sp.]